MSGVLSTKAWAVILSLFAALSVAAHAQATGISPLPTLVTFVAPPYPRRANDAGLTGITVTRLKIGKDGRVVGAKIVRAHALFVDAVLDALKQWKFAPSDSEHELEVTCRFEFYTPDRCSATPETTVSATLPTDVLIRTTPKCATTPAPTTNR